MTLNDRHAARAMPHIQMLHTGSCATTRTHADARRRETRQTPLRVPGIEPANAKRPA
jgi:hypothetical protein